MKKYQQMAKQFVAGISYRSITEEPWSVAEIGYLKGFQSAKDMATEAADRIERSDVYQDQRYSDAMRFLGEEEVSDE